MSVRQTMRFGPLEVGRVPRVVGTICRADALARLASLDSLPCELVEFRLDKIGTGDPAWLTRARAFETRGLPVIVTVRLAAEGGDWTGPDTARAGLFDAALAELAAVDIELQSALLPALSARAHAAHKAVIVSFHDFERTPPLAELREIVQRAAPQASVVKVATMIHNTEDVTVLRQLLESPGDRPLAVMGMGPEGSRTRTLLAGLGSCLAYGWLDEPAAPNQPPAKALLEQLQPFRTRQ